jgi:hypothetical protein
MAITGELDAPAASFTVETPQVSPNRRLGAWLLFVWNTWSYYQSFFYLPTDAQEIPNSATDIKYLGHNNICGHTTKLTTPMYFN